MYLSYFGLDAPPFSIVPDHKGIFMSDSHREAVAHLLYAVKQSGGFVQLTGEVGTGKTTVSRYILSNLPENVDVALLLNPRITEIEMLRAICDELGVGYDKGNTQNAIVDLLNQHLLDAHARGRHTVLMIDEAQNLSREVLEQIRLLTNLETSTDKLLQIILIGQPELVRTLARHDLRQLSQRIVGRFRLDPLNRQETREYIEHRLHNHGADRPLFTKSAFHAIHKLTGGIPRLINVLCDRALMGAYAGSEDRVSASIVRRASEEVIEQSPAAQNFAPWLRNSLLVGLTVLAVSLLYFSAPAKTWSDRIGSLWSGDFFKNSQNHTEMKSTQDLTVSDDPAVDLTTSAMNSDHDEDKRTKAEQGVEITPQPQSTETNNDGDSNADGFDLKYRLGVPFRRQSS
ncbi:MAG: AAA family ATPase [Pseudomonadota bacterium]